MTQLRGVVGSHPRATQRLEARRPAVHQHVHAPGFGLERTGVDQLLDPPIHAADQRFWRHGGGGGAPEIDADAQLPAGTAAGDGLADTGHRGEARHQQLIDQVEQGVAIDRAEHVHHHHEAALAGRRRLRGLHLQAGRVARLLALDVGRDAAQFQLADLDVAARFEAHPIAAGRTANAAAAFGHQRQPGDLGVQGQQDLALDHFRLRASAPERHAQGVALQDRHQFHGQALPGHQAEHRQGEKQHADGNGSSDREIEQAHGEAGATAVAGVRRARGDRRSSNR